MSDRAVIYEKLIQIDEALQRIKRRFSGINSPDDFLDSDGGLDMRSGDRDDADCDRIKLKKS